MQYQAHKDFDQAKEQCRDCLIGKVYNRVVLADGNSVDPVVLIIGEAPGREEVEHGKPFIGKAGKLLRSTLNQFGFRRANSLITNTIPCRPEDNKFPKDDSIVKSCTEKWLYQEIRLTHPKYIMLVGATPLKFVLGMTGITKSRGNWYRFQDTETLCMPIFHPSYVNRKEYMEEGKIIKKQFIEDIETVAKKAGFC